MFRIFLIRLWPTSTAATFICRFWTGLRSHVKSASTCWVRVSSCLAIVSRTDVGAWAAATYGDAATMWKSLSAKSANSCRFILGCDGITIYLLVGRRLVHIARMSYSGTLGPARCCSCLKNCAGRRSPSSLFTISCWTSFSLVVDKRFSNSLFFSYFPFACGGWHLLLLLHIYALGLIARNNI